MTDSVVLKNVELQWAYLEKKNDMSGKFQVDLANLSAENVEAVKKLRLDVKHRQDKPEKGFFITAKSVKPITALDANGDRVIGSVGNGTIADVRLSAYEWKSPVGNKTGRSPSIQKLVIRTLKEYKPEGGSDDDMML